MDRQGINVVLHLSVPSPFRNGIFKVSAEGFRQTLIEASEAARCQKAF
jgi:hypothetical protein